MIPTRISFYLEIEKSIDDLSISLRRDFKNVEEIIETRKSPAMKLPNKIGNSEPLTVPLRFASRLGFKLVNQLLELDQIFIKLLMAHHVGLIDTLQKDDQQRAMISNFRKTVNMIFQYKVTGVTRDDIAANNAKAIKAREAMGRLDDEYLQGTLRSPNAPRLPAARLKTLQSGVVISAEEKIKKEAMKKSKEFTGQKGELPERKKRA